MVMAMSHPNNIGIRLAKSCEAAILNEIEIAASSQFAGLGLIDHRLDCTFDKAELKELIVMGQVWVACDADVPVGFAIASVKSEGFCYLEEIDVLPQYGRRGIGATLVQTVRDWAARNGMQYVFLATFRSVPWNAPFYAKLGFSIVDRSDWTEDMHRIHELEIAAELPLDERVMMVASAK
jgi:GNAT superfamily N-acetyltransferase